MKGRSRRKPQGEHIMLRERIIAALSFRREVYAEVEKDTTFTTTAWVLVVVVAFLNNLGTNASANLFGWLRNTISQTIVAIIGFALAALVMSWIGRTLFKADVTFEELVRTLGLAYVWNVVGIIGVVAVVSTTLSCLLTPALVAGWIMLVISWFVAAREALDLDTVNTIVTVVLGWIVFGIIMAAGSIMLALMGWTAAGIGSWLGF
jgi:hypothetical protein